MSKHCGKRLFDKGGLPLFRYFRKAGQSEIRQLAILGTDNKALGIAREITGKKRNRIFAYDRYLTILSEGTEPL